MRIHRESAHILSHNDLFSKPSVEINVIKKRVIRKVGEEMTIKFTTQRKDKCDFKYECIRQIWNGNHYRRRKTMISN